MFLYAILFRINLKSIKFLMAFEIHNFSKNLRKIGKVSWPAIHWLIQMCEWVVYIPICISVCTRTCRCTSVCVYMCKPDINIQCLLQLLHYTSCGSLSEWGGPACLHSRAEVSCMPSHTPGFWCGCWGSWLRASNMCSKLLYTEPSAQY